MQISKSACTATVNALTSDPELRWMIEPVFSPNTQLLNTHHSQRPAITQITGSESIRKNIQLSSEEEEKRRQRRERNKMAAAKCRNRRRELIDLLQEETELLQMEQVTLQKQVGRLQQEREQLKLLLESHASICTLAQDKSHSMDMTLSRESLSSRSSNTTKHKPLDDDSGSGDSVSHQAMEYPGRIDNDHEGIALPKSFQAKTLTYTNASVEDSPSDLT